MEEKVANHKIAEASGYSIDEGLNKENSEMMSTLMGGYFYAKEDEPMKDADASKT
jgi:hypothetical protein